MLERMFHLRENGSSVRREAIGGATTFFTLSYILFVQPAVLSACGMDHGAVALATCLASAIATLLMGLLANLPVAQAPAMGHNFYFAFTVCGASAIGGYAYPWTVGLGAVFVTGCLFILLSVSGVRTAVLRAFPASLRTGIAVGIGLLITLIGLQYGGIVVARPGTMIGLGKLGSPAVHASVGGTVVLLVLLARRVRGAMLLGIAAAALIGAAHGLVRIEGIVGFPRIEHAAIGKLDIPGVFREKGFLGVLFILLFLDFFDSVGTLLGVGEAGGLLRDGEIPRSKQAFLSDAIGTSVGALLGTSTVSSYVESASGIAEGARTGLASVVTAALLLLSIAFYPLVRAIGGSLPGEGGASLYPFLAPPLIVVGALMLRTVRSLDWEDPTEYLPAFLPMVIIPFSFSISEGIGIGFIAHALLKAASGRARELHPIMALLALLFLGRYLLLP